MSPTVLRWPVADLRRVSWVLWEVRGTRQAAGGVGVRHKNPRCVPKAPLAAAPPCTARHTPCAMRRGDLDVGFSTLETTVFAKARPGRRQRFIEAVSALLRLPCGARARGPSRNSLRSLRSSSNKRDESDNQARCARGHEPCSPQRLEGALPPAALREPSDQPLNNPRTTRPRPRVPGLAVSSLQIVTPGATCFDRLSTCRRYVPCV